MRPQTCEIANLDQASAISAMGLPCQPGDTPRTTFAVPGLGPGWGVAPKMVPKC